MKKDRLASELSQDQPCSRYHPAGPSQDRIHQHDKENSRIACALNEPLLHNLPQPSDGNGDKNASELEKDTQLPFKEQEKSASAIAPPPHSY
jgi:hypothetical protein